MYKRKLNQVSIFENPAMFGGIALNPDNEWVKLAGIIPWWVFEKKYAEQFPSNMGQPAESLRAALGSQIIKEKYQFSDEVTVEHIAMNPYLQYFIGLTEYRQTAPFDPSMLSRFRQRLTPEMLQDVNDVITGRKTEEQIAAEADEHDEGHDDDSGKGSGGSGKEDSDSGTKEEANEGTLILDATCAPQAIRFPTDTSLLNEARLNTEEIIASLHAAGLTDGRKPRTYRIVAKKQYNGFSKSRRKTRRSIRRAKREQLNYLRRNLKHIDTVIQNHPDEWEQALTRWQRERLAVIRTLYAQQREMYESGSTRIDDRIVSLSQPWVRPIVRGKQNAPVEFGAKAAMSDIGGFLRIELLS